MFSAVSTAMIDGVVSVSDDVFVAGVILEGELSEKVTRAFVGVDISALVHGILGIKFIEWLFEEWILSLFWAKKRSIFGLIVFILKISQFRA